MDFPETRPICCNREMYAAGGTTGTINKDSVRYWRCEICGRECEDIIFIEADKMFIERSES